MNSSSLATEKITQGDVDALLDRLRILKQKIKVAREGLAPLKKGLEKAKREYEDRVNSLLRSVNLLRAKIDRLDYEIKKLMAKDSSIITPTSNRNNNGGDTLSGQISSTPITTTAPVAEDKDQLLEHAYRILDPMRNQEDADLIGKIQGLINNPVATLADILEHIPWGDVWQQASPKENLATQHGRLISWERALKNQLALLEKGEEAVKKDLSYPIWQQMQQGNKAWKTYLSQVERQLREEIADLEQRYADREKRLLDLQQTK